MTDRDTLELRRMVDNEPAHAGTPDLPALISAGRRVRTRRRAIGGGAALGVVAAVAAPLLVLTGGSGEAPGADRGREVPAASAPAPDCGVVSCVDPGSSEVEAEAGTLVGVLPLGGLRGGAEEIVYIARSKGDETLMAGYRAGGTTYRTAWVLDTRSGDPDAPRFWSNAGPVNREPGDGDHYVVLGYVDGSPDEITWSSPDGESGEVDGVLRLDGYTAFYLTQPLPAGYVDSLPEWSQNDDGSVTIVPDEDHPSGAIEFPPELTISTSDGWSCTLRECGSIG
ncbi:hypothetical protein [Nocardioides pantholopis]|uniref:hypothetical protein n=1 Tax=Nocardioides pantholopis TaxID=2483798 RepID=UPI000F08C966|nr:hypothetical protein [Nocardioides pantholopis]